MTPEIIPPAYRRASGFLGRLARDTSGNTFAMLAAAVVPVLALVGGGVDMGRSYLAQTRLQQACDAGTLAARKMLATSDQTAGTISSEVTDIGFRFFDLNYRDGAYGTSNRSFTMSVEDDYAVSGVATTTVPTTIMALFGNQELPLEVECEAQLNFSNTDVMMVLDSTGSMRHTNPGDSMSRMETLKQVVRDFHAKIEGGKSPMTRVRYGFVPYATNVNVGGLLKDDWVVTEWTYQGREYIPNPTGAPVTYWDNWATISGNRVEWTTIDTYAASVVAGSTDSYECTRSQPADTWVFDEVYNSTRTETVDGVERTIESGIKTQNGSRHRTVLSGTTCQVQRSTDTDFVQSFDKITVPLPLWEYKPVVADVSGWRSVSTCIEERSTYEIDDYDNVDLSRALDLDIDLVPTPGNEDTQWRPQYRQLIYAREISDVDGTGTWSVAPVTNEEEFADTGWWWMSTCPAPSRKLAEMSATDVDAYLATLKTEGATYHDIGMIWGGRLLSPDGLFATENADVNGDLPTSRHLIFLTDGQTEPYDIAYGAYGLEPLDQRRWSESSSLSLLETVEKRFLVACDEIKKKNVRIWVIAFGTNLNPITTACASPGAEFEADDASELNEAFEAIANSIAELRVSR